MAMRPRPVAAMATAGAAAHGWGRFVLADRARSAAQPRAKPSSAAPVLTPSVAPGNTTIVRTAAARIPTAEEMSTTDVEDRLVGDVSVVLMRCSLSQQGVGTAESARGKDSSAPVRWPG